jgi:hypothetical protein
MLATCGERNTKTGLGPDAELHLEAGRAIDAVTVGKVAEAGVQRQLAIERVFVIGPAVRPASADATPCPIALIGEIDAGKVNLRTIEEFVIEVGEPVDIAACHPAGTVLPDTEVTDMSLPCRAGSGLQLPIANAFVVLVTSQTSKIHQSWTTRELLPRCEPLQILW